MLSYEETARVTKATKLVYAFKQAGADAEAVRNLDESGWIVAALAADVRLPSARTRALVAAIMDVPENSDPLAGLPS